MSRLKLRMRFRLTGTVNRLVSFSIKLAAFQASGWAET
jgi:hypothetical protein